MGGRTFTQWTMPIPQDGAVLRRFPNLKSVRVCVAISGLGRGGVKPEERDARRRISNAMIAFKINAPNVKITTAYTPSKNMSEAWTPLDGRTRVEHGVYVDLEDQESPAQERPLRMRIGTSSRNH